MKTMQGAPLHYALFPLALMVGACGSDETAPPADDHTPVSYTVLIEGTELNHPIP